MTIILLNIFIILNGRPPNSEYSTPTSFAVALPGNDPLGHGGGAKAEVDLVYPSGQLAFSSQPHSSLSHFPFSFSSFPFLLPAT